MHGGQIWKVSSKQNQSNSVTNGLDHSNIDDSMGQQIACGQHTSRGLFYSPSLCPHSHLTKHTVHNVQHKLLGQFSSIYRTNKARQGPFSRDCLRNLLSFTFQCYFSSFSTVSLKISAMMLAIISLIDLAQQRMSLDRSVMLHAPR